MFSHVSRSVALSMLGYSCLAHSYWQRCHKTGLRGAISGEEETVEELTRRGPYACPVDCLPQALSPHPSLHCIIHSFSRALSARTSDFLELSALLFPQNNALCEIGGVYEETAGGAGERWVENQLQPLPLPIKGIFPLSWAYVSNTLFYLYCSLCNVETRRTVSVSCYILKMSKLSVHCNIHILQMATVRVVFASSYIMHIWVYMCWMRPTITQNIVDGDFQIQW